MQPCGRLLSSLALRQVSVFEQDIVVSDFSSPESLAAGSVVDENLAAAPVMPVARTPWSQGSASARENGGNF